MAAMKKPPGSISWWTRLSGYFFLGRYCLPPHFFPDFFGNRQVGYLIDGDAFRDQPLFFLQIEHVLDGLDRYPRVAAEGIDHDGVGVARERVVHREAAPHDLACARRVIAETAQRLDLGL